MVMREMVICIEGLIGIGMIGEVIFGGAEEVLDDAKCIFVVLMMRFRAVRI